MNSPVAASAIILGAALASVPGAAIAYALPSSGPIIVPARWWWGEPAPLEARIAIGATAGATAGVLVVRGELTVSTVALAAMAVVCVALAVADVRRKRLPHRMTAFGWCAAVVAVVAAAAGRGSVGPAVEAVSTTVAVGALLLGLALAVPGQLGLGDVNFVSSLTLSLAWSSWTAAVAALLAGLLLQAVVAIVVVTAGAKRQAALPLGPALAAGWFVVAAST